MKWRKRKRRRRELSVELIPPNNTFFRTNFDHLRNVKLCSHMGISLRAYESWKIGTTITIGNSCPRCGNTHTHVKRVGPQQFETVPNV
jgi:hypothetical protein